MDEDQWTYDYTMSQEVHMDYDNEEECGVNEPHVDCSNVFNTCQVFGTRDDVLQWARTVAHENGFVAVIMRSDTDTGSRGRSSFVLIGCERSGLYKSRNKEFVRRDTGSRKCGCPFRLHRKPVHGEEGWMEHNANSCTMIKQIYNARSAYRSSIRGADTEMQHLMKLLERDQYIHWHRLKDEVVVQTPTTRLCWGDTNGDDILYWVCISGGFHIDKNVKAKCKSLIGQKNAWHYVMDNWGTLVDCPSEQQFADSLQKFQIACSPWPMFIDYVNDTWIIPLKEKFIIAWTNKVMHLGNTTTNRYTAGSIPVDSVHMFWRRLCFSDQGLCEAEVSIKEEIETISKRFEKLDVCGKLTLKSKLRDIAYPDHNSMCPPPSKVNTKGALKKSMKRSQRSTKRDPSYWEYVDAFNFVQSSNSSVKRSASSSEPSKPTRIIPMLNQFAPFI
ncbi:hypothetical protein GmHk_09G025806 [Glycine max]|nr:hypothetical protein GmHk_09G025806 [Glycine max]